jgi:hypothetical protein
MTPLLTIMLMHIGGETFMAQFDSQMECGRALLEFSTIADDLEREYQGEAWAQCVRTYAPSRSIRPKARPIDT